VNINLAYLGRSTVSSTAGTDTLSLAPNLAREPVSFDAALLKPLRFREAISALHDVVVADLRFKKKDKTAYEEFKKVEANRLQNIRRDALKQAKDQILKQEQIPRDFEAQFKKHVKRYWSLRQTYSDILRREDPTLWRMLTPCDPVITVADDVLFFECFSVDESAYGCLTVARDAFGKSQSLQLGTTNVDYSWNLYNHFQGLRSYRETRFKVDPAGFTVKAAGASDYHEEKIDLPQAWLRGFMQIQSAIGLPSTHVQLSRETVYSILAYLKRHRQEKSPRALRFELTPGKAPVIVLEPWEIRITSFGTTYQGPPLEPIRIWGRRRLAMLARVLPLTESFSVHLLGTGLPSFWLARMGEMTLTVGLSGWTTNDWTRGSALDLLMPPAKPQADSVAIAAGLLQQRRSMSLNDLLSTTKLPKPELAAVLNYLAYSGQMIHDLGHGCYRWRSIMPMPLGEAQIGPENEELAASRQIVARGRAALSKREVLPQNAQFLAGTVESTTAELILDPEGRIKRGKCQCSHYRMYGTRNGPCRHMLALRVVAMDPNAQATNQQQQWLDRVNRLFTK
jgi:hypothetical protein